MPYRRPSERETTATRANWIGLSAVAAWLVITSSALALFVMRHPRLAFAVCAVGAGAILFVLVSSLVYLATLYSEDG